MTRQLKLTAIHEAAHAVMHYCERIPFEYVTIVADSELGSSGSVHPRLGPVWLWDRQRPKTIRILLAGKVAEEFYMRKPVNRGCERDLSFAGTLAAELEDECRNTDAATLLAEAYIATRERLTAPSTWLAVEALASALLQRQTLNRRQAYGVIRAAVPGFTYLRSRRF
jgi:hypothetical protein